MTRRLIFKNVLWSLIAYFTVLITSFVSRKILVDNLGIEYAGIEGVFLDIVTTLGVVEFGIGKGFVYKLFQPLHEKNYARLVALLRFFKKCFIVILLIIVASAGISAFFLIKPIKEIGQAKLTLIATLYILEIVSSYLFAVKRTLLMADLESYFYINVANVMSRILKLILQCLALIWMKSFFAYLIFNIFVMLFENTIISVVFDKKYPILKETAREEIGDYEKKEIRKNIVGFLCHKIAGFVLTSAASMAVINFVALEQVGIYANYSLVITMILGFTKEIFNSISAFFGNKISVGGNAAKRSFEKLYFINFLIYSSIVAVFYNMINPMIELWIAPGMTFNSIIVLALSIYVYMYGMRQSIMMMKATAGIYDQDKFLGILGTVFSVSFYILFGQRYGILGIILATTLGLILIPCWSDPFFVYNFIFKCKSDIYQKKYMVYSLLSVMYTILSFFALEILHSLTSATLPVLNLILGTSLCIFISAACNLVIFRKKFTNMLSSIKK